MSNEREFQKIKLFKNKLDAVSPTFCTAKWLQTTLMLFNGEGHSCHHPSRHKIPVEGLEDSPSLLHNTPVKLKARAELLQGIKTAECEYCWRIENANDQNLSDRIFKSSASIWGEPLFDSVVESGLGENILPSYLEVAFESTCNFSCMYCTPDVSTQWMADIEKNGPIVLADGQKIHDLEWIKQTGRIPIRHDEYNPYIEAFWKWWPDLYKNLKVFRLTGGEPLLSKHTWDILDYIQQNPNHDIEISVNTNLNVPMKLIEKLISKLESIKDNVRAVKIFTSFEATGKHAEFIRYGMNYETFISNIEHVMSRLPDVRIVIMTTVNALSVFTFKDFLDTILKLRAKYLKDVGNSTLGVSINYLRWPPGQELRLLPLEIKEKYSKEILDFVNVHREKVEGYGEGLLYLEEIDQIERVVHYMMQAPQNLEKELINFKMFFNEYCRRRGLNFKETFPEIAYMVD